MDPSFRIVPSTDVVMCGAFICEACGCTLLPGYATQKIFGPEDGPSEAHAKALAAHLRPSNRQTWIHGEGTPQDCVNYGKVYRPAIAIEDTTANAIKKFRQCGGASLDFDSRQAELESLFPPNTIDMEETPGGWSVHVDEELNDDGVRALAKILKMAHDGNVGDFLWPKDKQMCSNGIDDYIREGEPPDPSVPFYSPLNVETVLIPDPIRDISVSIGDGISSDCKSQVDRVNKLLVESFNRGMRLKQKKRGFWTFGSRTTTQRR